MPRGALPVAGSLFSSTPWALGPQSGREGPPRLCLFYPTSFIAAGSEWTIISSGVSSGLSPLLLW